MNPQKFGPPCPDCATPLRLDIERARYYCDKCSKYMGAPELQSPPAATPQKPETKKASKPRSAAGILIFAGLGSFIYGVVQAVQAGEVETVFQQIVWANLGTQTMLGLLLVALGVVVKRLDVLVATEAQKETPDVEKPNGKAAQGT